MRIPRDLKFSYVKDWYIHSDGPLSTTVSAKAGHGPELRDLEASSVDFDTPLCAVTSNLSGAT